LFVSGVTLLGLTDASVDGLEFRALVLSASQALKMGSPWLARMLAPDSSSICMVQQIRSWRRLEGECRPKVEMKSLPGRLEPDYKSITHSEAVTEAAPGLVRKQRAAIDGSKFPDASSARTVQERESVKRYLEQLGRATNRTRWVSIPMRGSCAEKLMAMIRAGRRETRHGLRMLNQKPCSTHSQILLLGKKRALRKSERLFSKRHPVSF
jgi:hypothetical protein